jgi:TolB protein
MLRFGSIACLLLTIAAGGLAQETDRADANATPPTAWIRHTTDGHFKQRPVWSPDGARLVFARHHDDKIWLYLLEAATGAERRLTARDLPEYDAAWSPDGKRLAFSHVSQSGSQGDVDVYRVEADGTQIEPLAANPEGLSHQEWAAWSPDGRQIAFSSTAPGNQEVMVASLDGGGLVQVTNQLGIDAHPCWSPDGRRIAFATDRWGGLEIAVMDADGANVVRLTHSPGLDDYPAWSPDGEQIAFVSNRDGDFEVYLVPAKGGKATNVSQSPTTDSFPAWSPDGRRLTFVSNPGQRFDIFSVEIGGPLGSPP